MTVTSEMVEAAAAAIMKLRGFKWPEDCNAEDLSIGRENMSVGLEAALAAQWRDTNWPTDGSTFLVTSVGSIERYHPWDEGVVVTVSAKDRPFTCAFYDADEGSCFMDEFGEAYRQDGLVSDAEDETAEDGVLRLSSWMPLPQPPKQEVQE